MKILIYCDAKSHEGKIVSIDTLERPGIAPLPSSLEALRSGREKINRADHWESIGPPSRAELDRANRERRGLPEGSRARRDAAAKRQPGTAVGIVDGQLVDPDLGPSFAAGEPRGYIKFELECKLCGLNYRWTEPNLRPILNTLEAHGIARVSLRGLAVRMAEQQAT